MRYIMSTTALIFGLTIATTAQSGAVRWGDDLRFVADTFIPQSDGSGTVALCHQIDFASFLTVPVYSKIQGYALSNSGCGETGFSEITPEHFAIMQAASLIPADLPVTPSLDWKSLLWGHAWLIAAGVGIFGRGMFAIFGGHRPKKARAADALAIHSLVAMSQVAIADGHIAETETRQIAQILTRLTGNAYGPEQIADLLDRLNPSASDIEQVGQDLSDKDRQIVLEAALNIAVADGEIQPNEYAVVSDLAQRMRIGADQFRSVLARTSVHLQTANSA